MTMARQCPFCLAWHDVQTLCSPAALEYAINHTPTELVEQVDAEETQVLARYIARRHRS